MFQTVYLHDSPL